jgi:hypothetical protein
MIRIHPLTASLPPWNGRSWRPFSFQDSAALGARPSSSHRASRLRRTRSLFSGLSGRTSRWRRFILGRALRLDALRYKTPIFSKASFHQCLRLVNERVRQRIAAHITHRQRLPFSLQNEINAPRQSVNAPRLNGAADPQPVSPGISLQSGQLRDGVIVGFALAIAKPREKAHRHYNHANADAEFRSSLHRWGLQRTRGSRFAPDSIIALMQQ